MNLLEEKVKAEVGGDSTRTWEGGAIEQELGERVDLDEQYPSLETRFSIQLSGGN